MILYFLILLFEFSILNFSFFLCTITALNPPFIMTQKPNIAVLTFPGNNCEVETVRALKNNGMNAEVFLWNREPTELLSFDGVVIPGGFSFEDRGRSGIVSVQEPIFETLKQMAEEGKPILGICNGAQMLVESGLILADNNNTPAVGLLRNKRIDEKGDILGTGFYHSWKYIKPVNTKTPFSHFEESIYAPIAHGEGRFTFPKERENEIKEKGLIVFEYTNENGTADPHYPINPNGSFENAAAICNPAGNVVAMMPHPERSENGNVIFTSLKKYFQTPWELNNQTLTIPDFPERNLKTLPKNEVTVLVRLKITDKTEKTFANVLGMPELIRREKWGFEFLNTDNSLQDLSEIIRSGELINENKEWIVARVGNTWYDWNEGKGFEESLPRFTEENCIIIQEKEDFKGQSMLQHLHHSLPETKVNSVSFGVSWEFPEGQKLRMVEHSLFSSRVGDDIFSLTK